MIGSTGFILFLGLSSAAFSTPITTDSLIDEMADMQHLTSFPAPKYQMLQFSSYDRRSSVPGGENWFANSDGFGKEPIPNFEEVIKAPEGGQPGQYLMCDVEGPGAIVRLFTADIKGTVRVFLDNSEAPLYDGPAMEFFLHPYDSFLAGTSLKPEDLKNTFYQRNAAYAPIPFAKHCRIVWIGDHQDIHFYHIGIRKYESGAEAVTFTPQDLAQSEERIRSVASLFADVDGQWQYHSNKKPFGFVASAAPHEWAEGIRLDGKGAVEKLVLKVEAGNIEEALRQTILHINFDDMPWSQVESPIGDFFGTGPGINPYSSIPFSVAPDGTMACRFIMPYKASVRISFENMGSQRVKISGSVLPMDYEWNEASMYFRAKWRVEHELVSSDPMDLPFLLARGKGVYVGTAIMVLNPNTIPTGDGNWWGEGDEKVFVDNDRFPSIFGTGSEDYFNYAWGIPDVVTLAYGGQSRDDGPSSRCFSSNYRWHIIDGIPFEHNIAFYMEMFFHVRTEGISYARLTYCYAGDGTIDDHVSITSSDVSMPQLPAAWEPMAARGASNYAFQACEELITPMASLSFEEGPIWQGGKVLVWRPERDQDELSMEFAVAEDGDYELALACAYRPNGGSFATKLDGAPFSFNGQESICLSTPYHVQSRMLVSSPIRLTSGKHQFKLTAAQAGKMIGLDFWGIHKVG